MREAADPRRLFIAAALPRDARERLARLIAELRGAAPELRWAAPDNIHLTLRFLGDVPRAATPAVEAAMAAAAGGGAPFALRFGGLGTFGGRHPRVLQVGADAPELLRLAERLDAALAAGAGFEPREGPFRPHVTLARVPRRAQRGAGAPLRAMIAGTPPLGVECAIGRLDLVHSMPAPNGPAYRVIASARLGAGSTLDAPTATG